MILLANTNPAYVSLMVDQKYEIISGFKGLDVGAIDVKANSLLLLPYQILKELPPDSILDNIKIIAFDCVGDASDQRPVDAEEAELTQNECLRDINNLLENMKPGLIYEEIMIEETKKMEVDRTVFAVETDSKFGGCIEALVYEASGENVIKQIREVFLFHALGFLDINHLKTLTRKLEKSKTYSSKLIRAAEKALNSREVINLRKMLLDARLFAPSQDILDQTYQVSKGTIDYFSRFVNLIELNQDQCILYGIEDLDSDVLRDRVPGGKAVVSESGFGALIERLLILHDFAPDNEEVRELFCKHYVRLLSTYALDRSLQVRFEANKTLVNKIKRLGSVETAEAFQEIVRNESLGDKAPSPRAVVEKLGAKWGDYSYISKILPPSSIDIKAFAQG